MTVSIEDVLNAIKDLKNPKSEVNWVIVNDFEEDPEILHVGKGDYSEFSQELDPTIVKIAFCKFIKKDKKIS